jgi:N-acetylmuramic acid 6-phosphate etherase
MCHRADPEMREKNGIFDEIKHLTTEQRNPRTRGIDLASTEDILRMLNGEDRLVADAVGGALPDIARVVELVVASFKRGGRLLYFGAGTSGRLGVIDAAECPPTFGVDPGMVVGVIAGGRETVFLSQEGIEDDSRGGERDVAAKNVSERDTVVGIAASRRTPYVLGALSAARARGAATAMLRCNDGPKPDVDVVVTVVTGPEAIAGSTRLKAGTAQKMVLNMITTASMVKLGKIYENLMVDLRPNSEKLIERGKGIVMVLAGVSYAEAEAIYEASGRNLKVAVLMARMGIDRSDAERALLDADGFLARALGERQ